MNAFQSLEAYFGPLVVKALRCWLGDATTVRLAKVMAEGGSGAKVAAIYVQRFKDELLKLIMKVTLDERSASAAKEAWRDAGDFRKHLTQPYGEYHVVPDVGTIQLLKIGGGNLEQWVPLSSSKLDNDAFLLRFGAVVEGVLREWNLEDVVQRDFALHDMLSVCLAGRFVEGGRVRAWAEDRGLLQEDVAWLQLPGDGRPLLNPFQAFRSTGFGAMVVGDVDMGPRQADLHLGNVLVCVEHVGALDFYLTDLDRYEAVGIRAIDVAQLLFSRLHRELLTMDEDERLALIRAIADGTHVGDLLPPFVRKLLDRFKEAASGWAYKAGRGDDWETQLRVAMIACALMYLGRDSALQDGTWVWFLRLASRLTGRLLRDWDISAPEGRTVAIPA